MNSSSVAGILVVLVACLVSFNPYTKVQNEPAFQDAPVMRISETFDSRFQMVNLQKTSRPYFDSRLESPELLVTMELKDVELTDAFARIARQVGIPILTVDPIKGRADLSVSDVPLEQVLEMLTLKYGYDFVWLEDRILIGATSPEFPAYSKISYTTIFRPRFVSAGDIGAVLSDVYAPYIKAFDEYLMVTAPFSTLRRIQEDIALFDVPEKQIALDIRAFKAPIEIHPELDVRFVGTCLTTYSCPTLREFTGYHGSEETKLHADLIESYANNNPVPLCAWTRVVVSEGTASRIRLWWKLTDTSGAKDAGNLSIDERSLTTLMFMGYVLDDDSIVFRLSLSPIAESLQSDDKGHGIARTIESQDIVVRSGESVVLGGLLKGEEVFRTSHVPVLAHLPIVGELFQWKYRTCTDMEIAVIIRATILDIF